MRVVESGRLDEAQLEVLSTDEYADINRGFGLMLDSLREEQQILEVTQDLAGELLLEVLIARIMTATTQLLDAERGIEEVQELHARAMAADDPAGRVSDAVLGASHWDELSLGVSDRLHFLPCWVEAFAIRAREGEIQFLQCLNHINARRKSLQRTVTQIEEDIILTHVSQFLDLVARHVGIAGHANDLDRRVARERLRDRTPGDGRVIDHKHFNDHL